jgi:periplasmic divalent cation tolerance protein
MKTIMTATSSNTGFVELMLTCASWQEAQRIVDHLLEQRLIACAEFIPVKSKFRWKGAARESDEIKLIMQSAQHHFDRIEAEITQLHSYETFVLQALPIAQLSHEAAEWMRGELKLTD